MPSVCSAVWSCLPGSVAAALVAAAALVRVPACLPRAGQLGHELAQVMTGEADLATLRYQCLMAGAPEMIIASDLTLVRQEHEQWPAPPMLMIRSNLALSS